MCHVNYTIFIKFDDLSYNPSLSLKFDNGICCIVTCFWGTDTEKLLNVQWRKIIYHWPAGGSVTPSCPCNLLFHMVETWFLETWRWEAAGSAERIKLTPKQRTPNRSRVLLYFIFSGKKADTRDSMGILILASSSCFPLCFLGPPRPPCWESRIGRHRASSSWGSVCDSCWQVAITTNVFTPLGPVHPQS